MWLKSNKKKFRLNAHFFLLYKSSSNNKLFTHVTLYMPLSEVTFNKWYFCLQARRLKAIAEDPAIAAEAAKQPPEEDDEKDEIDDEIVITHL